MPLSERNYTIDAARGVALFLVALSHAHDTSHYVSSFYIVAFFFLSGMLYKPGRSYSQNIRKKAKRVLLPYFVNSGILLVAYILTMSFSVDQTVDAIKGVFYSRYYIMNAEERVLGSIANAPLWYLTAFFSTTLLFHLVVDRFTNSRKQTLLLCIVLISLSVMLTQLPILLPWSIDMIPFFTVVMIAGYLFAKQEVTPDFSWTTTGILMLGYFALSYENGPINLSVRDFGCGQIMALATGICGTLACMALCARNRLYVLKTFFLKIGTNSIVVLSFHLFFFAYYKAFFKKKILPMIGAQIENSFLLDMLLMMLAIFTCLAIGYLMDYRKKRLSAQYQQRS
jgi:fucose 4-O-acetylase-like acetyltransferase